MSVKSDWVDEFENLLLKKDPRINKTNEHYAYQLAVAYFDWNYISNQPAEKVEEAFERYLEAQDK